LLQTFYKLGVIRGPKHTHHKFKSVSERLGEIRVRIARVQAWYGSVRVVREQGVEDGSFQAPKVEPKAFERILSLESRWVFLAS